MVSAPDKPMKSSSTVREAASKLVSTDLPLYMACPCRITKPPVAQLTRSVASVILLTVNPLFTALQNSIFMSIGLFCLSYFDIYVVGS